VEKENQKKPDRKDQEVGVWKETEGRLKEVPPRGGGGNHGYLKKKRRG